MVCLYIKISIYTCKLTPKKYFAHVYCFYMDHLNWLCADSAWTRMSKTAGLLCCLLRFLHIFQNQSACLSMYTKNSIGKKVCAKVSTHEADCGLDLMNFPLWNITCLIGDLWPWTFCAPVWYSCCFLCFIALFSLRPGFHISANVESSHFCLFDVFNIQETVIKQENVKCTNAFMLLMHF